MRVCFAATPDQADLQLLGGVEDRWLLYRRMVRSRLAGMVASGLKRSKAVMGGTTFNALAERWLSATPPATRYIREVIPPFAAFAVAQEETKEPGHLRGLIAFEAAFWQAGYHDADTHIEATPFDFSGMALCNPTLRLLKTDYPVHEVPYPDAATGELGLDASPALSLKASCYAVYRKRDDTVTSRLLTERAYRWLTHLTAPPKSSTDNTVTARIKLAADGANETIDAPYIEALGATLATLLEQDILLGCKP